MEAVCVHLLKISARCKSSSSRTASPLPSFHTWYQISMKMMTMRSSYHPWHLHSALLLFVSLEGRNVILFTYNFQVRLECNLLVTSASVAQGGKAYAWTVLVFKHCLFWGGFCYLIITDHLARIRTVLKVPSTDRVPDLPRGKKYCFQIKYYLDRSLLVINHNLQALCYLTELIISTSLSGSLVL